MNRGEQIEMNSNESSDVNKQQALGLRFAILESESDRMSSLYDIVDRYRRKLLLKPPHQRQFVWDERKRQGWVDRIRADRKPVGTIVTYQIRDDGYCPIMINDGIQRTSTTLEYLENPDKYGDDAQTAERYCRAVLMPVQHRIYSSTEEALRDFQLLNIGTALTPQEFCAGILVYMAQYEQFRKSLQQIQDSVSANSHRIVTSRYRMNRKIEHRNHRHNLAMFHRFAANEKGCMDYNAGRSNVKPGELEHKTVIEWKLRLLLERSMPAEIERQVNMFCQLIERETALFLDIWHNRLGKEIGVGINDTLYRWLLDVAIWKRHNAIPIELWSEFVEKLLRTTGGRSQLVYINDEGNNVAHTLATSQLSRLQPVCEILKSPLYSYATSNRTKRIILNTQPGFDKSHIEPVAIYGDGPAISEPASLNRSRGKAKIEKQHQKPKEADNALD